MISNYIANMQLQLQQLLPVYFEEAPRNTSEVWRQDLNFSKGEYVKIVAPSGSGKTSLMHFLYGLRNDYNGSICYDVRNIKSFSAEDFAAQRKAQVSIVFQDLRLLPEQTVY